MTPTATEVETKTFEIEVQKLEWPTSKKGTWLKLYGTSGNKPREWNIFDKKLQEYFKKEGSGSYDLTCEPKDYKDASGETKTGWQPIGAVKQGGTDTRTAYENNTDTMLANQKPTGLYVGRPLDPNTTYQGESFVAQEAIRSTTALGIAYLTKYGTKVEDFNEEWFLRFLRKTTEGFIVASTVAHEKPEPITTEKVEEDAPF